MGKPIPGRRKDKRSRESGDGGKGLEEHWEKKRKWSVLNARIKSQAGKVVSQILITWMQ